MAIDSYAKLQSEIMDTLNKNFLAADVTRFSPGTIEGSVKRAIRRTELRCQRRLRAIQMEGSTTGTLSTSADYITSPTDLVAVKLFYLSTNPIRVLSAKNLQQLYIDAPDDGTGIPDSYAVSGARIYIRPQPGSAYNYKLFYYQQIPALTDSNTTNWLLDDCPDIYLYGSCVELTAHIGEDERIQVWKGALDEAIADVNGDATSARYSGVPLSPVLQVAVMSGGTMP
jgi:hypothetical protein